MGLVPVLVAERVCHTVDDDERSADLDRAANNTNGEHDSHELRDGWLRAFGDAGGNEMETLLAEFLPEGAVGLLGEEQFLGAHDVRNVRKVARDHASGNAA